MLAVGGQGPGEQRQPERGDEQAAGHAPSGEARHLPADGEPRRRRPALGPLAAGPHRAQQTSSPRLAPVPGVSIVGPQRRRRRKARATAARPSRMAGVMGWSRPETATSAPPRTPRRTNPSRTLGWAGRACPRWSGDGRWGAALRRPGVAVRPRRSPRFGADVGDDDLAAGPPPQDRDPPAPSNSMTPSAATRSTSLPVTTARVTGESAGPRRPAMDLDAGPMAGDTTRTGSHAGQEPGCKQQRDGHTCDSEPILRVW
jgi:hypothetical protein